MEPVTVPAAPQNVSFITDMVASRNARIRLTPRNATSYDITRDVVIVSDPTLLVLASLADGEKHGYAMMEDIQRFAGVRLGPGIAGSGNMHFWDSRTLVLDGIADQVLKQLN